MAAVRKLVVLVIAVAMIASGGWLLIEPFTTWPTPVRLGLLSGGFLLVAFGFMLLWEDFISPMLRR
jgi:hypothetical protein